MDLRAKGFGYNERIEAYPDGNEFQYLNSPSYTNNAPFGKSNDNSAATSFRMSQIGADAWNEPLNNSGPQFTPPPPRRTFFGVVGSWTWELLSCLLAVGALIGILVVLKQFNGKSLQDWPYHFTINTLVSVLVTIIKVAIVVPLAEGISQLKWSWYKRRENTLADMVVFDGASRGIFGASRLLFTRNPFHFTTVASFLFLASLAIGPFAQQVVQFGQRDIQTKDAASVPICSGDYHDFRSGTSPGLVDLGLSTLGAIYDGYFQINSKSPVQTSCQTGNCTFATYQSLGFCSRCADISDELVQTDSTTGEVVEDCPKSGGCSYDLRQGQLGLRRPGFLNSTTTGRLLHRDMANISGLVNLTIAYNAISQAKAAAFECALYFCVLQYGASVVDGEFSEIPVEVSSKLAFESFAPWSPQTPPGGGPFIPLTLTPETCFKDGIARQPPYGDQDNCTYTVDGMNGRALNQAIAPLLEGYATYNGGRYIWLPTSLRRVGEETGNKINTVDAVFKSLATRLTNHVRTAPNICRSVFSGTVWSNETYISVRWPWIFYPIAVVGATFLLLLAIIIKTRDEYIWKSSPLALVFLGMRDHRQADGVTHPIFPANPEIKSMEASSKGIKMRLDRTGRWNIVGNR